LGPSARLDVFLRAETAGGAVGRSRGELLLLELLLLELLLLELLLLKLELGLLLLLLKMLLLELVLLLELHLLLRSHGQALLPGGAVHRHCALPHLLARHCHRLPARLLLRG